MLTTILILWGSQQRLVQGPKIFIWGPYCSYRSIVVIQIDHIGSTHVYCQSNIFFLNIVHILLGLGNMAIGFKVK